MSSEPTTAKHLGRAEFTAALRKGQGRALLHVIHYGLEDVADLILEACLHNQVYDQQIETSRDHWLFSMLKDSASYPKIRTAILKALKTEPIGYDLYQLFLLARTMAIDEGDEEARQIFGETIFRIASASNSIDWLGVEDWLELAGAEGMLQLARIYGQRLLTDPDDFVNEHLLDYEGHPDFRGILYEYSEKETAIKAYREYLEKRASQRSARLPLDAETQWQQRHKQVRKKYSLQSILEDASKGKGNYPGRYMTFGKHATQEELDCIYTRLMGEATEKAQTRLLWVFRRAKLPHLDDKLFDWAHRENEQLRAAAIGALAQISDQKVHLLARKKVETGRLLGADNDALDLFLLNFETDDAPKISQSLVALYPDPEDAHSLGYSIRGLAERYDDPALAEALLWTYENTPCGLCRLHAVEQLHKWGKLTDEMRFECQYDADENIREFVQ